MVDTQQYSSTTSPANISEDFLLQIISKDDSKTSSEDIVKKALMLISEGEFKSKDKALECGQHTFQFAKDIGFTEGIIEAGIGLSELYWHKGEFKMSLEYAELSLKHNETIKNQEHEARILKGMGNSYLRMGFVEKALNCYFKSLNTYQRIEHKNGCRAVYNNLGIAHKNKGEYEKALSYYIKSLEIKEDTEDFNLRANIYINISILYHLQNQYEKSLAYLEKVLKIPEHELGETVFSNVHNNMGQVYVELGDYKKALDHIEIALEVNTKIGNKGGMALSYQEIGRIMELKKHHEAAIKSYTEALRLSKDISSLSDEADCLYSIGQVYYQLKTYDTAEEYLLKSYQIREELQSKQKLIENCKLLANLYHDTERFPESCSYMKQVLQLQEELSKEEKTKLLAEMQTRFEVQQRDMVIETLNVKQELLLKANQELELFAGKAAHDLKEPIRMMSSFSSLLVRKYGSQLDDTGQEFVKHIHDGAKRMEKLLTDMLTFAKSGADPSQSVEVNLNDILYIVKSNLKLKIAENQANIQSEELPLVKAANVAMIQLFQNIIANAIKFRKPDVAPIIKIASTPYDDNFHQISIADNGIGIPKEQAKKVFIIFQRLHAREEYEGSGIGLATCKKIVECLGGKIWIESAEGEGTTFFFLLPKNEN